MNKFWKQPRPDWDAITEAINALPEFAEKPITVSIVVNVARGWSRSQRILEAVQKIAPDCLTKPMKLGLNK